MTLVAHQPFSIRTVLFRKQRALWRVRTCFPLHIRKCLRRSWRAVKRTCLKKRIRHDRRTIGLFFLCRRLPSPIPSLHSTYLGMRSRKWHAQIIIATHVIHPRSNAACREPLRRRHSSTIQLYTPYRMEPSPSPHCPSMIRLASQPRVVPHILRCSPPLVTVDPFVFQSQT